MTYHFKVYNEAWNIKYVWFEKLIGENSVKLIRNKFENNVKVFSFIIIISLIYPMTANALPFQFRYGMQASEISHKASTWRSQYAWNYDDPCSLQPHSSIDLAPRGSNGHSDLSRFTYHLRGTTAKDLKNKKKAEYQEYFIKFLRGEREYINEDHIKFNPKFQYLINVVEKLFETDEFKAFLEFQLPDDKIIIYDIDGDLVCAQFLDNELVQVSLNSYGFKDKLLEIFNVIKVKYKIQTTTYKLHEHESSFVIKGSADAQDIGNVEIFFPDPNFKEGFLQSTPLLSAGGVRGIRPYITYSEPLMIKRYNEKIQESQVYYEKNILAPMLDRIDKLSIEEINKKDPYLDQF